MKTQSCVVCGKDATKVLDMKFYCRKCWKQKRYEMTDELLRRNGNEAKID